jgi:hypothetical protein
VQSMGIAGAPGNPYAGYRDGAVARFKPWNGRECTT